jgi:hypothetical protein
MSAILRRRASPERIALGTHHSTLLIKMISLGPAGLSLSDLGMFLLDVLDHLQQTAPLVDSQRNAGLCRFNSAALCQVVLPDVDASVSGGHRHVPRCADVQTQLEFFFSNQLVDRVVNLVKELDELRLAWTAERRHHIRSVFKQTDHIILYYNKTFLTDFKRLRHFRSVIVECDGCDSLNTYCSVIVRFYPIRPYFCLTDPLLQAANASRSWFCLSDHSSVCLRCSSLKIFPSLSSICLIRRLNRHLSAAYCIHCPLLASRRTSAGQSFSLCTITRSSNLTVLATVRDCIRIVMSPLSPSMSYCVFNQSKLNLQCTRFKYNYRCNVNVTWVARV